MTTVLEDISLDELGKVAEVLTSNITNGNRIIAFYGQMGVGKTTLIKTLCEKLGVIDSMNSPTFGIVNEYFSPSNGTIYHFDFYRLNDESEAYDFGYEEYFYSDNICLIEWPEKIENLLPQEILIVRIEEINQTRTFKIDTV